MRPALSQADAVSAVVALVSLGLTIAAQVGAMREHRGPNRPPIFDAWRAVALFGFWSTLIFATSILDPRLYVDDYQEIGLRPIALWAGVLALGFVYAVQRLGDTPRAEIRAERAEGLCEPCSQVDVPTERERPSVLGS